MLDDTGKNCLKMVKVCIDRDGILGVGHLNECKFNDRFKDEVDRVVWNTDTGCKYNQKIENRT